MTDIGVGKGDGDFDMSANEIARLAASNHDLEEDGLCRRLGGRAFHSSNSYGPQLPRRLVNNQAHGPNDPNDSDDYDAYGPAFTPFGSWIKF